MALQMDPNTAPDTVVVSDDDDDHHLKHGVHKRIRAKSTIMNYDKILGSSSSIGYPETNG